MRDSMNLEDLKNYSFEEAEDSEDAIKSTHRNHSREIAITISYLLGIYDEMAKKRYEELELYDEITSKLSQNEDALAIRHLNNIRTNIMLNFKWLSRSLRNITADYKPIYMLDDFVEDFKVLKKLDISIVTGRWDLNEYIRIINAEITKRIDRLENIFPDWISFRAIKSLFIMPDIENESKKFQYNQKFYPFQRYLYWSEPKDMGYILYFDSTILEIAYRNAGEYFDDYDKITDASDNTKSAVSDFIDSHERVQIFIDGENADPYKVASAIYSLADCQIEKTDKIIVYYDEIYSSRAWQYLSHFVFDIPVEIIPVERISEDKSLVDHSLVVGVSKAVYRENSDGIILISSDSDFWSVIRSIDIADFLVMVETEKCGHSFKTTLRTHGVFYCYLDNFKTIENNKYFKTVFRRELEDIINSGFTLGNSREIFSNAVWLSRAELSPNERENLFDKYIKGLRLVIDSNGNFKIQIPE